MEKRDKVIDKYYKEKNELQCQVREQQAYIECLQEELKEVQTLKYDEQSHFIRENEYLTTIRVLVDELAKLRSQKGL